MARQIRRIPPRPPQERRSQRRHQGSRHRQPDREAHPSQPSPQAAPSHLPRSRPRKSPFHHLFTHFRLFFQKTQNNPLPPQTATNPNTKLTLSAPLPRENTDKPLHVEPLPHRTDPDRRRRGRAKGPPDRRARTGAPQFPPARIQGSESHHRFLACGVCVCGMVGGFSFGMPFWGRIGDVGGMR